MDDTTALSYWLNWRFFLCALWVLIAMTAGGILLVKYEVFNIKRKSQQDDVEAVEPVGILYEDETWKTSLKSVHPVWLLAYRFIAFCILLALLTANLMTGGVRVFFFYTQWTFALVTFYFGLGSLISVYGCCNNWNEIGDDKINHASLDTEEGSYTDHLIIEHGEINVRKTAGILGYFFQIVFQICAGSVVLTDSVFWLIIYSFLTPSTYKLSFLRVCFHSINALLLLIDVILNRLRFPLFRLAYFGLWTCIFVIFQWIFHACVSIRWPYPFLDLSSPYAPIWYLGVGLIHLPSFGIFALIVKWKQQLLLSRFSENLDK